ncbi:MAG TPA: hypothetical protein ACHBX0_09240 [Arsenophonus sp.]
MKSNIYQFPQGTERQAVKKSITTIKRKKRLGKIVRIIMTSIRWLWFALRITLANMLYIATVAFFTFLHAFNIFSLCISNGENAATDFLGGSVIGFALGF